MDHLGRAVDDLRRGDWLRWAIYLHEVDSTNTHARRLLLETKTPGLPGLIVADRQTAGRGRGGRTWHSPGRALTFSLLTVDHDPTLSLRVGLAVAEAVDQLVGQTGIAGLKWPNDVYLSDRKLGGILIERIVGAPGHPPVSIIGVGLNIDAAPPTEDADAVAAISLADVSAPVDRGKALTTVVGQLTAQLQAPSGDWLERYRRRCVLTDRPVRLQQGGQRIEGICRGVRIDGCLCIQTAGGMTVCSGGEVDRVRPTDRSVSQPSSRR